MIKRIFRIKKGRPPALGTPDRDISDKAEGLSSSVKEEKSKEEKATEAIQLLDPPSPFEEWISHVDTTTIFAPLPLQRKAYFETWASEVREMLEDLGQNRLIVEKSTDVGNANENLERISKFTQLLEDSSPKGLITDKNVDAREATENNAEDVPEYYAIDMTKSKRWIAERLPPKVINHLFIQWFLQQLPEYLAASLSKYIEKYKDAKSQKVWREICRMVDICPLCNNLTVETFYTSVPFAYLQHAVDDGCEHCKLLLTIMEFLDFRHTAGPEADAEVIQYAGMEIRRNTFLDSWSGSKIFNFEGGFAPMLAAQLYDLSVPAHVISSELSSDSKAKNSLTLAKVWLHHCREAHPSCRNQYPDFMPDRLLRISKASKDPVLIQGKFEPAPYVALLYCWGNAKDILVTNRNNLEEHLDRIVLDSLPLVLQDAATVCRLLDVDYLWVDSLCIIQNDEDQRDWSQQSAQMRKIYSGAELVIAVESSPDCTIGFLEGQDTQVPWRPFEFEHDGRKTIYFAKVPSLSESIGSIQTTSLSRRGWAMQEVILPNRILHFTEREMIWECNTNCRCACGTPTHGLWKLDMQFITNSGAGTAWTKATRKYCDEGSDANSRHLEDFLRIRTTTAVIWAWERLVELYSQRQLTVASDKLSAISGLVQSFQDILGNGRNHYIAGLWKDKLVKGLLWHVTGSPPSKRPAQWRAPTWSWASIDGGIGYFLESYQFSFEEQLEILRVVCATGPFDPTGRISDAYIEVRGILQSVRVHVQNASQSSEHSYYVGCCGKPRRAHDFQITRVSRSNARKAREFEVLPDLAMDVGSFYLGYFCLKLGRTYSAT
ncbi:HET-domain-containing protein [Rhizodiscina lignyota]|uniref:HET-domain-containing protein n=1 Tax=Rhizodiscina lignyota TaxID=1504668 RepID=A0A9P4I8Q0_9PEZI|nr:HET-domain-containing protein [Rhizodiscina lignyota]